jgi:hypothetical protein
VPQGRRPLIPAEQSLHEAIVPLIGDVLSRDRYELLIARIMVWREQELRRARESGAQSEGRADGGCCGRGPVDEMLHGKQVNK